MNSFISHQSRSPKRQLLAAALLTAVAAFTGTASADSRHDNKGADSRHDNKGSFANDAGTLRTFSTLGSIRNVRSAFFRPLGKQFATTCEHCHFASDAWSISAEHARKLFDESDGKHPLFTAPTANDFHAALALGSGGSLEEREEAYSQMLNKGNALVRRNLNTTSALDFTLTAVIAPTLPASLHTIMVDDDGHVVASGGTPAIPGAAYLAYTAQDNGGVPQIWLHRRPLPTTNFAFLTAAAWDGQDTRQSPNPVIRPTEAGVFDIARATIRGRGTGPSLIAPDGHVYTAAELDALATELTAFMSSLFVAQETVHGAGSLSAKGATGGVANLANQPFHFGINDVLQGDLSVNPDGTVAISGIPFTPNAFTLFDAWQGDHNRHRASIERGQALFNAQRLLISGVGGLNDAQPLLPDGTIVPSPLPSTLVGSCTTCHDSPNVGNHSTRLPINIGVSDKAPAGLGRAAVEDLPLFIITRNSDGAIKQTTDPGRAVISGKFEHIGQFKGPILHGIAARPPFFHNGMATRLEDVVNFYDARFNGQFTAREKTDLVNFLKSL